MKKFEYKIECHNDYNEEKYLNEMGQKGWELVSIRFFTFGNSTYYYWKKEIITNDQSTETD